MNKKIIALTLALIAVVVAVSSCANANLVSLKYKDGMLINKSAGLTYKPLPLTFEPAETVEEYAVYKETILYTLKGMDPTKWISEKYEGIATVFCAEDIEIPTLLTFGTNKITICLYEELVLGIHVIEDAETIATVIDMFENGEETVWPLINSIGRYQLKFESPDYPGIYFNLEYGIFEEGSFIYDRTTKRCVSADGIFDGMINP
jgi:hypothetical protein